jgi:hypothetical protein
MKEMESDYSCRIMRGSLAGDREIDEQTFTALEILQERLEKVKSLGGAFSNIRFSPAVMKLAKKSSMPVC